MEAVGAALRNGNLECMKLLLDRLQRGDNEGPTVAVENPTAADVKLTEADESPTVDTERPINAKILSQWTLQDVAEAARKGHLDCLALAVAHGCPWRPEVRGSKPCNVI